MEVVDDCCGMGSGVKFSFDDFELELPHILWKIIVIADSGIGKPGGGFGSGVCTLESHLKVFNEVGEGPEGGGI